MKVTKYCACVFVMAFMVGVAASSLVPQPANADPGICECYTMAYCISPAPWYCDCPSGWDIITYDMTWKYTICSGDVCSFNRNCGISGCIEDCYA